MVIPMAVKSSMSKPKIGKAVRTGFEKMQMSHRRTAQQIRRIQLEAAERAATGKPVHRVFASRNR
jgi:hypothetical protein